MPHGGTLTPPSLALVTYDLKTTSLARLYSDKSHFLILDWVVAVTFRLG